MTDKRKIPLRGLAIAIAVLIAITVIGTAIAYPPFVDGIHVSTTLEGCRADTTGYLTGTFICADADYTTGNLGKGWNELDLVPHRLTTEVGNQADATTDYNMIVAGDNSETSDPSGVPEGYDFISVPTVNAALSHESCEVTYVGDQQQQIGITGGAFDGIYRIIGIHQDKGTTCVFDFVQRLSITASSYSGSSLQAYIFGKDDFKTGKKTVPIPVGEVLPQKIDKTMTASQDSTYAWALEKTASPVSMELGNTCDYVGDISDEVTVSITWEKLQAAPDGDITVITSIHATNPSRRIVTVNVADVIYGVLPGETEESTLDTKIFDPYNVPADSTVTIGTHTYIALNGTTALRDVATATYTDYIFPEVPIPGEDTAEASAPVEVDEVLNDSATVTDVEQISGSGLSFTVDTVTGVAGSFTGYELGDNTTGPVNWSSGAQVIGGTTTFNKTVYAAPGTNEDSGLLSDTATLNGSDGYGPINQLASTSIVVTTLADLTINKTIPDYLTGEETLTFSFEIWDSSPAKVAETTIDFSAGETSNSVIIQDLPPDVYTVYEDTNSGWESQDPEVVDLTGYICAGSADFTNEIVPARAQVKKVTVPAGSEDGWEFKLYKEAGEVDDLLATKTTTDAGYVDFGVDLEEGSYYITEVGQDGWTNDGTSGECSFTVDYPTAADQTFQCTFTNNANPANAQVKKVTVPAGYEAGWEFTLYNAADDSVIETVTTIDANFIAFATDLYDGSYYILETGKDGWTNHSVGTDCAFSVSLPADRDKTFSCEFGNSKIAEAKVIKTTTEGDEDIGQFPFTFELYAPDLDPDTDDPTETKTLNGAGNVTFDTGLEAEGTWTVVEILPVGWVSNDDSLECTFDVAYPGSADVTYTCTFNNTEMSRVEVYKLSKGIVDPTKDWKFAIFDGPNDGTGSGFLGSPLADSSTLNDIDGVLQFGEYNLDPNASYTVCELGSVASAGWTSEWYYGDVPIPTYNPHEYDGVPQSLGVHCVDFGAGTGFPLTPGEILSFTVYNNYPGGEPRTPGYWMNWSSCTNGNQFLNATGDNDPDNEFWALDELLNYPGYDIGLLHLGDGLAPSDEPSEDCEAAVLVLDNRQQTGKNKKMASDAAYNLARSLLAYELNQTAGACPSGEAETAAMAAQALLVDIGYDGTSSYLRPKDALYSTALDLHGILDYYNNGGYCGGS